MTNQQAFQGTEDTRTVADVDAHIKAANRPGDKVREAAQAVVNCWWSSGLLGLDAGLLNALNDALASPPQEQAPGWMPIESAPKDGTLILLAADGHSTTGGWVSDMDSGAEYEGQLGLAGWWAMEWPGTDGARPTLWQPLPAAPSQEQAKGRV